MTDEAARLISSLKNDRAYLALIEHLEDENRGILGALEMAESPSEVLRLTRLWQIAVKIVSRLRTAPEAMSEKFKELAELPNLEPNPWGMTEEEDPFTKPRPPIAPPYQDAYSSAVKST